MKKLFPLLLAVLLTAALAVSVSAASWTTSELYSVLDEEPSWLGKAEIVEFEDGFVDGESNASSGNQLGYIDYVYLKEFGRGDFTMEFEVKESGLYNFGFSLMAWAKSVLRTTEIKVDDADWIYVAYDYDDLDQYLPQYWSGLSIELEKGKHTVTLSLADDFDDSTVKSLYFDNFFYALTDGSDTKPVVPTLLWDFDSEEAMSEKMGANSNNGVMFYGEENYYTFMATSNDPYVSVDTPMDSVEDVWWAKVRVHNPSPATAIELFGATSGRSLSGPECTHFEIEPNCDEWRSYVIYIPDENIKTANTYKGQALEETYWEGNVDWIRLDPMWHEGDDGSDNGGSCESGDEIHIDYIAFFDNEADARAYRAAQDTPEKYVAPAKPEPAKEEEPVGAPNPLEEAPAAEPAKEEAPAEVVEEAAEAVTEAVEGAVDSAAEAVDSAAEAVSDAVEEAKGGCGSFVGGGFIVLVTILGCGWMTSRKR